MKALIVTSPFGGYEKGVQITDAAEIAAVLDSENASHVVAVNAPDVSAEEPA